ncbi:basic helix-loop-helix protein [Mortierella polycephala]|uniref:Basic helix-loop-helix protein n=1 Tax=Mortierella polycephala TaxID=41804 RepID=A0A9P6TYM3_9FUNG|nr:basic helix-loop-helix protein [Mortierella polycephala]
MATNPDVQEVLKTLKNSLGENLAETITSAIAQHNAATAATSAALASEAASTEQENASDHEKLQRIAEQHQQEIQQEQVHQLQRSEPGETAVHTTVSQDDHEEVLKHIATAAAAAEASSTLATVPITEGSSPVPPPAKPVPGSEEWHKMRRDNHKEVERRRRETINAGINDLAKSIPNSEKNKGSILRQAVKYIRNLQLENERLVSETETMIGIKFDIEKLTLEKSVADATYEALIVDHQKLKLDFDELRKKTDDLDEHTSKKQRTE